MSLQRILLSVIVTALLLATTNASAPRKSSQDQYEQRNDQAQTETDGHKPLIHRVQLTSTGIHNLSLLPHQNKQEKSKNSTDDQDFQVGCGDGSVKVKSKPKNDEPNVIHKKFKRDVETQKENVREKRDYIRWLSPTNNYNTNPQYPQILPQQPLWNYQTPLQNYRIYLPIWGNPRTIPVFFPHRVVLYNPGYPTYNRPSIITPPRPTEKPTGVESERPTDSNILGSRFGDPNREEGVSWGFVESEEETSGGSPPRPTSRPTIRPTSRPQNLPSFPNDITRDPNELQEISTPRPRPTTRPTQTTTTTTTPSPGRQLPRCVWAIISCCNPANEQIRYNCFENLGCPGSFWDRNPCSKEVTQAAFDAAQEFYDQYDQS